MVAFCLLGFGGFISDWYYFALHRPEIWPRCEENWVPASLAQEQRLKLEAKHCSPLYHSLILLAVSKPGALKVSKGNRDVVY